jgi:methionine biosynthesis protein MetW
MMKNFLGGIVDRSLNYGRDIIVGWSREFVESMESGSVRILDIGCGDGTDLLSIKNSVKNKDVELYGIEYYEPNIREAEKRGVTIFNIDIERNSIPAEDGYFDIVIANQVIEHTKEIFWIFSEISRVLKSGGLLIVGIPNLGSLHNRFLLLFGRQPTCIGVLSSHVRAFTIPAFRQFIETDGYFKLMGIKGSNFYPFPAGIARLLSKFLPRFSVCSYYKVKRLDKDGTFIKVLDTRFFETPYYRGEE